MRQKKLKNSVVEKYLNFPPKLNLLSQCIKLLKNVSFANFSMLKIFEFSRQKLTKFASKALNHNPDFWREKSNAIFKKSQCVKNAKNVSFA